MQWSHCWYRMHFFSCCTRMTIRISGHLGTAEITRYSKDFKPTIILLCTSHNENPCIQYHISKSHTFPPPQNLLYAHIDLTGKLWFSVLAHPESFGLTLHRLLPSLDFCFSIQMLWWNSQHYLDDKSTKLHFLVVHRPQSVCTPVKVSHWPQKRNSIFRSHERSEEWFFHSPKLTVSHRSFMSHVWSKAQSSVDVVWICFFGHARPFWCEIRYSWKGTVL